MSILKTSLTTGAVALTALALTAGAQAQDRNPAVDARQGHMQIMALNLGILGNMARGNTDYDAEVAQAAADNLVAMGTVNQRFYWPPGTDSESYEGSRALPVLWEDQATLFEIAGRYTPAAEALAASAGQGLDAMRGAVGPVGAVCGDCHEAFQEER
ncbi:c-type cytochrome [Jannaschia sp. CCS1]|uniref:c-type cytochrome n=1 Tax=Jannaschia sp. (strain CCS1) TaxID=290400 RepID=UPI000053CD83|nr:cytochrome c [Jannaschia sp. CCS1]ABD55146.1 cytochrome c class II [Jannaschia sp. CCS1]